MEIDKVKIEVIEKMPLPTNMKGVRSFLEHANFYCKFIKNFSKIVKPLSNLLAKDTLFNFNYDCVNVFCMFKEAQILTPIMQTPNWSLLFEYMCD